MAVMVARPAARFASANARHRMVDIGELTGSEVARWLELRACNPALDSPYFHPAFAAAVAATRAGVRVMIGEDHSGAIASFLPLQFDGRACRPAGFPAADFQGPICAPDLDLDLAGALRSCGVGSYRFDHMREGVAGVEPWIYGRQRSPYVDVSGGMDSYLSRASRSGKDNIAQARRHGRKAEREHGSLRFVAQSGDVALLEHLIAFKRRQYAATGARDHFADAGHVGLLHRLLGERRTEFSGMLSAVYAGPHLLAAHFGLRAGPVLHWWFPVYDPKFSRLAPGWLLLRALIDAAPDLGLERIDLGRGDDEYKRRAMTGYQLVHQGAITRSRIGFHVAVARRNAGAAVKDSRIAPVLRRAARASRRRPRVEAAPRPGGTGLSIG